MLDYRPLSRQDARQSAESFLPWPLQRRITVGVVPFRNLTGGATEQSLVEDLTDRLVNDLFRHCRGLSVAWAADEPPLTPHRATPNRPELDYLVAGSVLQNGPATLRINMRIRDTRTAEYRWAGRHEAPREDLASVHNDVARQISRQLKILALETASRDAITGLGAEPGVDEALSQGAIALGRELRPEPTAEAQRWFLAALAGDPRNPRALSGLAGTCQLVVSGPCWVDAETAAAAFDLGSEAVAMALELEPGNAFAKSIEGMLHSVAGDLERAASAFGQALALDPQLARARAFDGYNRALLGRAEEALPAIDRAMRLSQSARHHSVWFFFAGFAELLLGRTELAMTLLNNSLERNPTYGPARFFLMAGLVALGRRSAAESMLQTLRNHYPRYSVKAFEQLWLSRSASPVYRAQVYPLFQNIWALDAAS
jgi:tetratricopeptide (TPR) repeat protein